MGEKKRENPRFHKEHELYPKGVSFESAFLSVSKVIAPDKRCSPKHIQTVFIKT